MNASVYLFGVFESGYSQFPDDNTSCIFKEFYSNAKAVTQVAIHRDGNLMYYAYIRKLEREKYIGFCLVVNGLYLRLLDRLFPLFEKVVSDLVIRGKLLQFNEQGDVETVVGKLYLKKEDIDFITSILRIEFGRLESFMEKLPAINYGRTKTSVQNFVIEDDADEIIKSSFQNGFTYVYKSKDYNTEQFNNYKGVLNRISEEKTNLKREIVQLQKQIQSIQRQKKQFKNVILLFIIIIACSIGIYFLKTNLNNTQERLNEAKETIRLNDITIQNRNETIASLNRSLDSLQNAYNNERNVRLSKEEILRNICETNPFIVTSSSVSSSEFTFNYYAVEDKQVSIILKAINENNSEVVSNSHTLMLDKGSGTKKISFNYRLDSRYYYDVVLIYNGNIVAGKRW